MHESVVHCLCAFGCLPLFRFFNVLYIGYYNVLSIYTAFLVHPTSIAAVDGSTVEFTCTANDTDTIVYRVNDTEASLGSVTSIGFNQLQTEMLDTRVIRRNLSVTVSSLYNNTGILCRAIDGSVTNSNVATLTVQGNTHVHDNQQSLLSQSHFRSSIFS